MIISPDVWSGIAFIVCVAVILIILGMAWLVGVRLFNDKTSLVGLLHEPDSGKASLSRFQFLVFTFVIAGLYLGLSLESGTLIEVPDSALWMLGISGGSYIAARGVSAIDNGQNGNPPPPAQQQRQQNPPPPAQPAPPAQPLMRPPGV